MFQQDKTWKCCEILHYSFPHLNCILLCWSVLLQCASCSTVSVGFYRKVWTTFGIKDWGLLHFLLFSLTLLFWEIFFLQDDYWVNGWLDGLQQHPIKATTTLTVINKILSFPLLSYNTSSDTAHFMAHSSLWTLKHPCIFVCIEFQHHYSCSKEPLSLLFGKGSLFCAQLPHFSFVLYSGELPQPFIRILHHYDDSTSSIVLWVKEHKNDLLWTYIPML